MANEEEYLKPVHPGEILLEDFMKPLNLSQNRLAREIGVPPRRINEIIHGKRAVTAPIRTRTIVVKGKAILSNKLIVSQFLSSALTVVICLHN